MISPTVAIGQLLSDLWAMEPNRLDALVNRLMHPRAEGFGPSSGQAQSPYHVDKDGVAHVAIRGVMLKEVPWIFEWLGIAAASTTATRMALQQALDDPDVRSIQLDIDSPGGQVQGTQELADDVFRAQSKKPTKAVVSDTAASAAYWVAAQAEEITANKGALVGAIGVYAVYHDASKMAEDIGLKVHVIRSADLKGVGASQFEALTEERIASIQREVDAFAALFVEEVARGRNVSVADIKKSATGETWLAGEALSRGLIDQVGAKAADEEEEESAEPDDGEEGEDEEEEEEEEAADPPEDEEEEDEEEEDEENEEEDEKDKGETAPSSASTKEAQMATRKRSTAPDPKGADVSPDKARADAAEAQLTEIKRLGCMDMIEAAAKASRVLPPARKHVEAYAKSVGWDSKKLKTFLDNAFANRQTNPERASVDPESENTDTDASPDSAEATKLENWLGIPKDAQEKFNGVAMVTPTGKLLDESGEEVVR